MPSNVYNREYLLSDYLEGFQEFKMGGLSYIKQKMLKMLELRKGINLLEVGVGRGELLYFCAKEAEMVWGIDFSTDAIDISRETLRNCDNSEVLIADAKDIPFSDNSFDRVFAGDVIEHMSNKDGIKMLSEIFRVLRTGGFILIHTSPNRIFKFLTFPIIKPIVALFNNNLVVEVEKKLDKKRVYHIFEYTPNLLIKSARKAGIINCYSWIDDEILRKGDHELTGKLSRNRILNKFYKFRRFSIVKLLFGNDIYFKGYKVKF